MNAALLGALLCGSLATAHPMHTSVTELVHDARSGTVTVMVRVFADDFRAAAGGAADSLAARYLRPRITLTDRTGRVVALAWERSEPAGDALLIHLFGRAPSGVSAGRFRQAVLLERFADQVNLVRVRDGSKRASLWFVRGDQAKALP
jgi:hypothetical protein